ncbi:MAG: flagellar hook-associated protein FlgL [Desulfotignum sp.]|nr:flagellar hook-associated protein FlgL [Desulfotignum sp.]MCF8087657.1 flagellar hook-associated protein FlgL [Desulfotignum sp.]MCF8136071.1 flagellar hook-associated protein FlgL [Desulfotignum sp.]
MRVATSMMYSFVRNSLADITRDLNDASETVITGKRINALSDDPMDMVKAQGIKSTLNGLTQLERGIAVGNNWLTASENALTQAQDLISESKTLALQMANAPISPENRKDAAGMVQHIEEQMMSLANTQVEDRYIFSGYHTDTPSFAVETDEIDDTIKEIVYQGDDQPFSIKLGTDTKIEIGGDGDKIFSKVFDTLDAFKTALDDNDLEGIDTAIKDLEKRFSDLNSEIAGVGSKMTRLDMKSSIFQEMKISETERLSSMEDADIIAAITHLEQIQLSYQAAMSSSSKLMSMNLLDYLK